MQARRALAEVLTEGGDFAGNGLVLQGDEPDQVGHQQTDGEYHTGAVGSHQASFRAGEIEGNGRRDKAVKEAHRNTGDDRDREALAHGAVAILGQARIDQGTDDDRGGDQTHAGEKERRIAHGLRHVVGQHPDHQGEADGDGEGHCHAGNIDRRDQQNVGEVEHRTTDQRRLNGIPRGLGNIRHEGAAFFARAADGEGEEQGQQQYAEGVIPVEQLELPLAAGQFLGVGPGTPAEHGDKAHCHGNGVGLDDEHGGFSLLWTPAIIGPFPESFKNCDNRCAAGRNGP